MKLNPPPEFTNYTYDKKAASRSSLLSRLFGWLSFISLASAVCLFIFLPEKKPIILSCFVGFMILFLLYIISKILKRGIRCSQCQQRMNIIDVKWTPEQWKQIQGYELMDSFKGADGYLYNIDKEKQPGSTHYFIHAHLQRWIACHQCRVYFLNAKYMREMIFSTIYEKDFKQAKQN